MNGLWWWALPVVLLPVWWHRQRRRRVEAAPLATARFLPRSAPRQLRAWRWMDVLLLLVRCLLLAALVAWLADPVIAWRGDTVLVVPGGASADKHAIEVPTNDAIGWLRAREAQWKPGARITVVGPQMMAAVQPHLRHQVELKTSTPPVAMQSRHVAIVSDNPAPWRALFGAIDGPVRYVIDPAPSAKTDLIIWGRPATPPLALRAPMWWIVNQAAFPELLQAPLVDGIQSIENEYGRLWTSASWPPQDADAARMLFETWHHQYYAPAPYVAPQQVLAADPSAPLHIQGGALRDKLLMALVALFALERSLAHVRQR